MTMLGMGRRSRSLPLAAVLLLVTASAGCKQGPWPLWNAYASHFIDEQGRVIDPQGAQRTTSEGQSYALFFALVDNDRVRFDRLLQWTQSNLAGGNLETHLPGWLWGKSPEGQWKLLDVNPASDSDCWIAYTLLEAGRLWKNPAYLTLAHQMMNMIQKQEVTELPGFGSMLMPGPTALWMHNQTWTVNPSYVPLFLFERLAEEDPAGPWGAIAMNIPRLLRQSTRHGFAMDWVDYVPGDGFYPAAGPGSTPPPATAPGSAAGSPSRSAPAAKPSQGKTVPSAAVPAASPASSAKPPMGSYDAIRVYLWAGMTNGSGQTRTEMLGSMSGMASYLGNHPAPPEKVDDQGIPMEQDGPEGFSAALIPYLRAFPEMNKLATQQRVRIMAQFNSATGLYGKDPAYYDQNLTLFATGFLEDRFRFGAHGELTVEWTR